jgi:hypothetical protein
MKPKTDSMEELIRDFVSTGEAEKVIRLFKDEISQARREEREKTDNQWTQLFDDNQRPSYFVWIEDGQLHCLRGSKQDYDQLKHKLNQKHD